MNQTPEERIARAEELARLGDALTAAERLEAIGLLPALAADAKRAREELQTIRRERDTVMVLLDQVREFATSQDRPTDEYDALAPLRDILGEEHC